MAQGGLIPAGGSVIVPVEYLFQGNQRSVTAWLNVAPGSGSIQFSMSTDGSLPFTPAPDPSGASQIITHADAPIEAVIFTGAPGSVWGIL